MSTLKKLLASLASLATVAMSVGPVLAFNDTAGHWAEELIDQAAEQGIVDGSKPSFNPDANITRCEFLKLAVEAFLGGIDADVLPTDPTFGDVPTDHWCFGYAETAAAYGIVNTAPTLRANDPIVRAEIAKIVVEGAQLPTDDTDVGYNDVNASDWFAGYVNTLANSCVVDGSKSNFNPGANATRAEALKMVFNGMQVSDGADICTTSGDGDGDGDGEPTGGPATSTLQVELSNASPEARTVPLGGSRIPLLVFNARATGNEDVNINAVTVDISGLGDEECITGVGLYTNGMRHGSIRSVSSETRTARVNIATDPIMVPHGSTTEVVVAADFETDTTCEGDEFLASIAAADSVEATGDTTGGDVAVTGDFSVDGETQKLGNVTVGALTVEGKSLADDTADIGSTAEVARFSIDANSTEDVLIEQIQLEQQGGASDDDIGNCSLFYNGTELAGPVNQMNDSILFDLTPLPDNGLILPDGTTRTYNVKCDVFDGIGRTIQFGVEDEFSDAFRGTGLKYGFPVSVTDGGFPHADLVTIRGGDFNVSIDSVARDIPLNGNDVSIGTLTFNNLAGEDIQVKGFTLLLETDNSGAPEDFTDIKLVDVSTGDVVSGPEDGADPTLDATEPLAFNDDFEVLGGEKLVLDILVDVEETAADGATMTVAVDMSTLEVKGLTTNKQQTGTTGTNFKIRPTADVRNKTQTVANPGLDIVKKTLASDTLVAKSQENIFWQGTFTARQASAVNVTRLAFDITNGGGGVEDNIENCSLVTKQGSVSTVQDSGEDVSGGTVTFSSLDQDGEDNIMFDEGEQMTVMLVCDVASTLSDGGNDDTATFELASVTAEDPEGETADVTALPIASGATFTLVDSGTLTITLESNDSPDPMIVLENATGVELAAFKFDANNEDAQITKLSVLVDGAADDLDGDATNDTYDCDGVPTLPPDVITCYKDAVDALYLYYEDGTPVLTTGGSSSVANSINASGLAVFNALDLTIDKDDDDMLVFVRIDAAGISTSGTNGHSGMTFRAALRLNEGSTDFDINGADSGTDYTTVTAVGGGGDIETDDGTAAAERTTSGDLMYLMNNKVAVTKPAGQATLLADSTSRELMKFTATPTGGNTSYLREITVEVSPTDADTVGLTINAVDLYSGATLVGTGVQSGNDWTITIDPGYANLVTIGGTDYDEINSTGETYTIRADVSGVGVDDVITTRMDINALEPGTDGFVFRDYGTDGTDGVDMAWVDLGTDEETSFIENQIDNK